MVGRPLACRPAPTRPIQYLQLAGTLAPHRLHRLPLLLLLCLSPIQLLHESLRQGQEGLVQSRDLEEQVGGGGRRRCCVGRLAGGGGGGGGGAGLGAQLTHSPAQDIQHLLRRH